MRGNYENCISINLNFKQTERTRKIDYILGGYKYNKILEMSKIPANKLEHKYSPFKSEEEINKLHERFLIQLKRNLRNGRRIK